MKYSDFVLKKNGRNQRSFGRQILSRRPTQTATKLQVTQCTDANEVFERASNVNKHVW